MYNVKNKTKEVRKFRDRHVGRDIFVDAKKSVLTNYPPKESKVWEINIEKEEKEELNTKEVKNGSSSSRRRMDGDLLDSNINSRGK